MYQHPDGRIAIDRRPGNYGVLVTDASGWVTPEVHLSVPAGFVRLVPETEAGAFVGDDPRSPHTAPKLGGVGCGSSGHPESAVPRPHPSPR